MEGYPIPADSKQAPRAFISYSHDSPNHKRWVAHLATKLRQNGVDVILDQWGLGLGDDVPKFMERSVRDADRVLMICTEKYVTKADEESGGVGYETMIVTGELVANLGTTKFIPVIRQQSDKVIVPMSVSTRLYINMSRDEDFQERFEELLKELHSIPKLKKPPLGTSPFAQSVAAGTVGETIEDSIPLELINGETDACAANQWRMTILFSPEHPLVIPKHQLLDQLIGACYSQPLDRFGRRYRFPLLYDRSNLLQSREDGWIGARIEDPFADEAKYEVSTYGSVRLRMIRNYATNFRAVLGDNALLEVIRFWPFASRYWAKFLPQMHYIAFHLEGIQGALLSLDISTYLAVNLVSKTDDYEIKDIRFLAASGIEGAKELLLQTCHNIVAAFQPPRGVSKDDLHLEYFQRKAKEYLQDVRDHDPKEE